RPDAPGTGGDHRPMPEITVNRPGEASLRHGHPWIFRASVARSSAPEDVAIVRIRSASGDILGCGIQDPVAPIAGRVWGTGAEARIDGEVCRERLARAIDIRRVLFGDGKTSAYRVLNGEGDRTPGFVLDRYADVAVLRIDGDAARGLAPALTVHLEP